MSNDQYQIIYIHLSDGRELRAAVPVFCNEGDKLFLHPEFEVTEPRQMPKGSHWATIEKSKGKMKPKPILFNTQMITALLKGRKTHTRRIMKPPRWTRKSRNFILDTNGLYHPAELPPPDEQFYVRESFWAWGHWELTGNQTKTGKPEKRFVWSGERGEFRYFQEYPKRPNYKDLPFFPNDNQWHKRSSIFMPRQFSRITLNVTRAWVERVQDISEGDAIKEGCEGYETYHTMPGEDYAQEPIDTITPSEQFKELWDSINKARGYGWNTNPPVLCREFEVKVK